MNSVTRQMDIEDALTVDLFSYAALSREGEASARADAALIRSHVEDIAKKGIEIGQALNRQKAKMGHGLFEAWVREECQLGRASSKRLMKVAADVAENVHLNGHLAASRISIAAVELFFSEGTPQAVRDAVEELLVDGKKVTVADIRRMKDEAAAAATRATEAEHTVQTLADRNAELALAAQQPAEATPVDIEAIKAEGAKEAESRLTTRINELAGANVKAKDEADALRAEIAALKAAAQPAPVAANVVTPEFGRGQSADPDVDEPLDEQGAINTFSGSLGAMDGLEFAPAAFWKQQGRTGSHGKRIYRALLSVNATIGLLIKEYSK